MVDDNGDGDDEDEVICLLFDKKSSFFDLRTEFTIAARARRLVKESMFPGEVLIPLRCFDDDDDDIIKLWSARPYASIDWMLLLIGWNALRKIR